MNFCPRLNFVLIRMCVRSWQLLLIGVNVSFRFIDLKLLVPFSSWWGSRFRSMTTWRFIAKSKTFLSRHSILQLIDRSCDARKTFGFRIYHKQAQISLIVNLKRRHQRWQMLDLTQLAGTRLQNGAAFKVCEFLTVAEVMRHSLPKKCKQSWNGFQPRSIIVFRKKKRWFMNNFSCNIFLQISSLLLTVTN